MLLLVCGSRRGAETKGQQQRPNARTTHLQNLNKQQPSEAYDWGRTAKMGALGAVIAGPVGLAFFRWMNTNILPHSPRVAMGVKVLLDQVCIKCGLQRGQT